MNIVNKAGDIHKNSDGLSRWALFNTPDSPSYVPTSAEPQILIETINITDVGTEFFEEVRESYKQDKSFHIITFLLANIAKIQLWLIICMIYGKSHTIMEDSIYLMVSGIIGL
ncbi:hypothetical protein O181_111769 [Austropuccinia psidii MF-1]|uniref:Uncharacterized protein n=1 Tax=Austropuccinia psidii MF-1 TaxID=1389203 RepID=A0A9Q3K0P2_9BASI|nr:hypothetical protein [Austropuccinia psidii MF-1]